MRDGVFSQASSLAIISLAFDIVYKQTPLTAGDSGSSRSPFRPPVFNSMLENACHERALHGANNKDLPEEVLPSHDLIPRLPGQLRRLSHTGQSAEYRVLGLARSQDPY